MFSIIVKPSVYNLDCFTTRPDVMEYAPVQKSSAFLPQWFKDLPTQVPDIENLYIGGTMRGCVGFLNQMKLGLVMPLWSDLLLEIGKQGSTSYRWRFSDMQSSADVHGQYERGSFLPEENYQHFKLVSPWVFKMTQDINWQCLQFPWQSQKPEEYVAVSGIIDFKYQHGTNINLIFPRGDEDKVVHMKHGTPLYQFVPITEHKVKHKLHLIDEQEMFKLKSMSNCTTFVRKYFNNRKLRCPFSK